MNINEKEICFIICTNDLEQYAECDAYIRRLKVPEGMSLDIISIQDAPSICEGYNAGMDASDAMYKVYMHQDVLILNPNFVQDVLDCFERNPDAGMLGMIGRKFIPDSEYFFGGDQYGALYESQIKATAVYDKYTETGKDEKVMHIDGLLMVTKEDIRWREDVFDGWDLYDISQSLEFLRKGYEIVVPYMSEPWVLHDCGFLNLSNYAVQREKFIKEYSDFPRVPVTMSIKKEEI